MSNCKEVTIRGVLPFNTYQYETLNKMLGQLNAPSFGFRINWLGSAAAVKNDLGGQTAMYVYEISGMEAVSVYWFAHLIRAIRKAGGSVGMFEAADIEEGAGFGIDDIEPLILELEKEGK